MQQVELSSEMTYSQALALFAKAWPNLPVTWYRPTIEHYKVGFPTSQELELQPDEPLFHRPGNRAVLRGDMTGQDLHSTIMRTFGLETLVQVLDAHEIWMVSLDESNAGVRRRVR